MLTLTAQELEAAGVMAPMSDVSIRRAVIDSRQAQKGDLFVCLKGEHTDGHRFIADALAKGATSFLVDQQELAKIDQIIIADVHKNNVSILACNDVLATLQKLATIRRNKFKGTVYSVVGSNGKTSTKEMLASVLRCLVGESKVFATPGNLNNHIGVPLSLLSVGDEVEHCVLELGMNRKGEISFLSKMIRPHYCVVPSIGFEHMEFFDSIDDVAGAELEVLDGMQSGRLVYPLQAAGRSVALAKSKARSVALTLFDLQNDDGALPTGHGDTQKAAVEIGHYINQSIWFDAKTYRLGEYTGQVMASNLFAILVLLKQVHELKDAQNRLADCCSSLKITAKGRFNKIMIGSVLLVDDTYNANPDSFKQSIRSLRELLPNGRLLCLAGHMAELGSFSKEGHQSVGDELRRCNFHDLYVCGHRDVNEMLASFTKSHNNATKYFADSSSLSLYLQQNPNLIKGYDAILVKGSRSAKMELLLPVLQDLIEH